jgi:hypothetical protein
MRQEEMTQEEIAEIETGLSIDEQQTETALLLQVSIGRLGVTRKADISEIETSADKALLKLSKRLFDCDEMRAIQSLDTSILSWVRARSIPSVFKSGIYQIRPESAVEIDDFLKAKREERETLVERFLLVARDRAESDRARLGKQFKESDYPSLEAIRERFSLVWRLFTLGSPDSLSAISPEIFSREVESLREMTAETIRLGEQAIRVEFQALLDHLVERLTPSPDGTKKRFHKSALENIREFIDCFRFLPGDDRDLAALLDQTKQILSTCDPESIRASEMIKEKARERFETVKATIDEMIETAPKRKVNLRGIKRSNGKSESDESTERSES